MEPTAFKTNVIEPVQCFKDGWELIKSDYWLLFAVSLLGALIGGFSLNILLGAMLCGIYFSFLRKIDTGRARFDDLWKGFGYFVPSLLVTILIVVPMLFVYGIMYVPIIFAAALGSEISPDELMTMIFAAIIIEIVLAFVLVCFHTLLAFAFPLIVDRDLPATAAVKTSARAVWRNLSGAAGLVGIGFLLMIPGILTCGIGMYFLLPLIFAAFTIAYRRVFPARGSDSTDRTSPPPPSAFRGAGSYN